jgi:ubiquinone/menaquinone biosynthesis C-methylase UbiE
MPSENIRNRQSAEQYHIVASSALHRFDQIIISRIQDLLQRPFRSHPKALDIGTATGRLPVLMAQTPFFRNFSFVASDVFPDMVEAARQHISKQGLDNRIHAVVADGNALPFEDNEFDLVFSRATFHHFKAPDLALREIYRVLIPGCIAVIHDLRRDAPKPVLESLNRAMAVDGYGPSKMTEKYTLVNVMKIIDIAGLSRVSQVSTGATEESQVGFEILLMKPIEGGM